MPLDKQSIAGSLFQTISRLCSAVAYGIVTAIFDHVQKNPAKSGYYANNAAEPYSSAFWFAAAAAFPSMLLFPFLRIGTQGHTGDTRRGKQTDKREDESEGGRGGDIEHAVITNATPGGKGVHDQDTEKV